MGKYKLTLLICELLSLLSVYLCCNLSISVKPIYNPTKKPHV